MMTAQHTRNARYTMQHALGARPVCTRKIWGFEHTHYVPAVLEDGSVRRADLGTADTFFTRPAVVTVNGKRVYGFVSINTDADDDSRHFYKFIAMEDQDDAKARYRESAKS